MKLRHTPLPFTKMHGLGNDFVILDNRKGSLEPIVLESTTIRKICDRHKGIGCDQLIVISLSQRADIAMRIFNQDGLEADACGNASRCLGLLLFNQQGNQNITIETSNRLLQSQRQKDGLFEIDMGTALLMKDHPATGYFFDKRLTGGVCVDMGNPHIVFFVADLEEELINIFGPFLEKHPLFPQGVNVSFARLDPQDTIYLAVWERGVGRTLACGSGACAAAFAAFKTQGRSPYQRIMLDGGSLNIRLDEEDRLYMKGPACFVAEGSLYL